VPARSFIAQGQTVHCAPGPDRWSWGGWKPITTLGFLWLGIANDGLGSAWSMPYLFTLPHRARSVAWLCSDAPNGIVAVPCEWPTWPMLHYSRTVAARPHVLQALNV
jgi:hypothetical protein